MLTARDLLHWRADEGMMINTFRLYSGLIVLDCEYGESDYTYILYTNIQRCNSCREKTPPSI